MRPRLPGESLRARLLLAAFAWAALAILIAGAALAWSFRGTVAQSFDTRLVSLLTMLIGSTEAGADAQLQLARPLNEPNFDRIYSGWYWLIADDNAIRLRSRSLWDLPFEPRRAAASARPHLRSGQDALGRDIRIAEQTVLMAGAPTPTTFVVTGDLAEPRRETARFNLLLWSALSVLGFGLALAVIAQVSFGLRPLHRIGQEIERVRSGEAKQLSATGTRELDALVREVNELIEHDRRTLERARANAADLAHALKTPLAVLKSSLSEHAHVANDSAGVKDDLSRIAAMERILQRQLARASSAGPRPGASTAVAPVVEALIAGMRKIYSDRTLELVSRIGRSIAFAGDAEDLEEILGNLLDNACKWARSKVVVTGVLNDARLSLSIDDDGGGMTEQQARAAVERGQRFDDATPGAGLGLAIAGDLLDLYGGSMAVSRSAMGGLSVRIDLPAAELAPAHRT